MGRCTGQPKKTPIQKKAERLINKRERTAIIQ